MGHNSVLVAHGGIDGRVRVENISTGVLVHEKMFPKPKPLPPEMKIELDEWTASMGFDPSSPHYLSVDNICFSPNDKFVAASAASEVRIWDVVSGQLCYMFDSRDTRVDSDGELHSLQYSRDSRMLLTAGQFLVARMTDVSFVQTTRCRIRMQLVIVLEVYKRNARKVIDAVDSGFAVFCGVASRLPSLLLLYLFQFV